MINSIATTQTVTAGENVLFEYDRVRTSSCKCGCIGWLSHDTASGLFTITKPGIYEISYAANLTQTGTTEISLALEYNGEQIVGSEAIYTPSADNAIGNVSNSILLKVPCGTSVTIALGNVSANDIALTDANIIIKKVA